MGAAPPQRIAVLGCIGAGKSTLARRLGERFDLPVVHLDRRWWIDGDHVITGRCSARTHALSPEAFREVQRRVVAGDRWVVEGDTSWLDVRLPRADAIVVLDLPRWRCAWRVVRRTGTGRDDYPPAVRESWRWTVVLVDWIVRRWPSRRRRIEAAIERHGTTPRIFTLRSQDEVDELVRTWERST